MGNMLDGIVEAIQRAAGEKPPKASDVKVVDRFVGAIFRPRIIRTREGKPDGFTAFTHVWSPTENDRGPIQVLGENKDRVKATITNSTRGETNLYMFINGHRNFDSRGKPETSPGYRLGNQESISISSTGPIYAHSVDGFGVVSVAEEFHSESSDIEIVVDRLTTAEVDASVMGAAGNVPAPDPEGEHDG